MSSVERKLEMLLESYNHSKRSPAYRELRVKYKSLKRTHEQILDILTLLTKHVSIQTPEVPVVEIKQEKGVKPENIQFTVDDEDEDESQQIELVQSEIAEFIALEAEVNQQFHNEVLDEAKNEVLDEAKNEDADEAAEAAAEAEADVEDLEVVFEDELEEQEEVVEVEVEDEVEEEVVEEEEQDEVEVEVEEEVEEQDEAEEEVEVEVEVEEEVEEEVEVEAEDEAEEEEEEDGVYEVEIKGVRYYTTNEQDGVVYSVDENDDVGDIVGKFVKGKLVLNK